MSVRVASARAWVKTRQEIRASKVMEGVHKAMCVAANTKPQEEYILVSFVWSCTFGDCVLVVDRSVRRRISGIDLETLA